jgi:diguanylate cyclase (GGDEF)-like protein
MNSTGIVGRLLAKPTLKAQQSSHQHLLLLFSAIAVTYLLALQHGSAKGVEEFDWIDILGEGATCVTCILWLHFSVAKRPSGPVTMWLAIGFALLSFSFALDLMDEIIRMHDDWWGKSLESITSPIAFAALTKAAIGLYHEQKVMSRQQFRREAHFRDHKAIDPVTDLYNASYLRASLQSAIEEGFETEITLIDLQGFGAINSEFGFANGDKILNRVGQSLVAAMPDHSLVCRYSGDRFAILSAKGRLNEALGEKLEALISATVDLALYQQLGRNLACPVTVACVRSQESDTPESLLERANRRLTVRK